MSGRKGNKEVIGDIQRMNRCKCTAYEENVFRVCCPQRSAPHAQLARAPPHLTHFHFDKTCATAWCVPELLPPQG